MWEIWSLRSTLPSAPTHSRGVGVPVNPAAPASKRRSRSAESKGRRTSRPNRSTRQWRAASSKSSMEPPNLIENATAAKAENDITATQASETASEDASFQDQEGMRVPEITEANEAIEANEATEGGEALSESINAADTELMHKTPATESKVAASPPNMKQVISLDRHSGYSMVHVYHEHDGTSPTTDGTEVKESESPFFLVNNRKGSRKVTKA